MGMEAVAYRYYIPKVGICIIAGSDYCHEKIDNKYHRKIDI